MRLEKALSIRMNTATLNLNNEQLDGSVLMTLPLPTGELAIFKFYSTNVMAPALAAKFPEIRTLSGSSIDFARPLQADIDYSPRGGLRAYIVDGNTEYYVDPFELEDEEYKVYSGPEFNKAMASMEKLDWSCDAPGYVDEGIQKFAIQSPVPSNTTYKPYTKQRSFTIALVANGEYSQYHGNTVLGVLAAMVTVLTRVNGIYKREVGVFLQLHPDNDLLICLNPCDQLVNTGEPASQLDFINSKHIPTSSYDLGHCFGTFNGGYATPSSVCSLDLQNKSRALTGLAEPVGDKFFVDFVSHEIGHQFGAKHTFADCPNAEHQHFMEPGSGTTIMGYAGLCGTRNVQVSSDPVFHAKSLEDISYFLENVVDGYKNCGVSNLVTPVPDTTVPVQCRIPTGSYFQLGFENPYSDSFFSYEQVSRIRSRIYFVRSESRFRTWMPTRRSYRTFPNMFYIIHNLTDKVYDEIVPTTEKNMTFRATTRNYFQKDMNATDNDSQLGFGSFSYKDVEVVFEGTRFAINEGVLGEGGGASGRFELPWSGGFDETLGVFIALHDASMDLNGFTPGSDILDYENQIVDLAWIKIAEIRNTENFTQLKLPRSLRADPVKQYIHVMVRSISSDSCFYFDIIPFAFDMGPPL
jgi:hypothetical protein